MKLILVHYHLKPGGVSTVLRRQVSGLIAAGLRPSLLLGEAPPDDPGCPWVCEPALGYDSAEPPADGRVAAIVLAVERLAAGLAGKDTLVHVHNPSIRKNSALLPALARLVDSGYRLLLQVHDLAEDWRPDVYSQQAYPDGCHWAAINRRDQAHLSRAINQAGGPASLGAGSNGAPPVFFLPNPVFEEVPSQDQAEQGPKESASLVLYPIRAIRRKNIGEALLLAGRLPADLSLGITLPPNSERDRPAYQQWRAVSAGLSLPVGFELGVDQSLDQLYRRSRLVLSTSVKEGFGLSFLEALARGRPVVGRALANVVPDFEEGGLDFSHLYRSIAVRTAWYDETAMQARLLERVKAAAQGYGLTEDSQSALLLDLMKFLDEPMDFGRLDETAQEEVLRSLAADAGNWRRLEADNPWFSEWWLAGEALPAAAPGLMARWSVEECTKDLLAAYREISGQAAAQPAPDKSALLALYLRPESLFGVGL